MQFYEQMAEEPRIKIQNTIIEQNRLLRILQEEPVAFSHNSRAYQTKVNTKVSAASSLIANQESQGAEKCRAEVADREFFDKNGFWLTGEVSAYLEESRNELSRKAQADKAKLEQEQMQAMN